MIKSAEKILGSPAGKIAFLNSLGLYDTCMYIKAGYVRTLSTMLGVRMHLCTTFILLLILPLMLSMYIKARSAWYFF